MRPFGSTSFPLRASFTALFSLNLCCLADLGVRNEAGRALLHQAIQRSPLGAVGFVVERGAIRSPAGLKRQLLHDNYPILAGLRMVCSPSVPCRR